MTQTHKLVVANQSLHADDIRVAYRVLFLPAGCSVNGQSGESIVVLNNLSNFTAGQKKTFSVSVTYSCPLSTGLIGTPFQLRLDVDHLGDDYPNPDNDDTVPSNNTLIKNKVLN